MRTGYDAAAASGGRLLRAAESTFARSTERLSTGPRINHAAAGVVSELVRRQVARDGAQRAVSRAHANNTHILPLIQFGSGQQAESGGTPGGFALAA